jgi:sporulation protein YlmC with PRC-barrel domain
MRSPEIDDRLIEEREAVATIRASAVLDKPAVDANGTYLGKVHDLFGVLDGPVVGTEPSFRIYHLLAGVGAFGDHFGYGRQEMKGPLPLRAFFEWLKGRAVGFEWPDVESVSTERIVLSRRAADLERLDELREPASSGTAAGHAIYLGLHLLDRQMIDSKGRMCGKVDDLELTLPEGGGLPYVTAILAGPGALAHRLGGRFGSWLESVQKRLHPLPDGGPARVGFECVKKINDHVELSVPREELSLNRFEEWVRDRFVAKIPGA